MMPGLLALHLLGRAPDQAILLLSADSTVGGEALEPVLETSLSTAARTLVEPFAVAEWPGYFVTRDGSTEHCHGKVLLLDPVQLWLELQSVLAGHDMPTNCSAITVSGTRLDWNGSPVEVANYADLTGLTRHEEHREILGVEKARALALPILADLDTEDEAWDAFQHIPLGDERVFVRKRRCRGDALAEMTSGFGRLLSDLIGH